MVSAWTSGVGAQLAGPGAVTILHGTTFALAAANGDMDGTRPHGFFFRDTRFISGWRLRINGKDMEPLVGTAIEPYKAMFVGRVAGSSLENESHVLVERHRSLNGGLKERIVIHNYSKAEFAATIFLEVAADFADLFDVKAGIRRFPRRKYRTAGWAKPCRPAAGTLDRCASSTPRTRSGWWLPRGPHGSWRSSGGIRCWPRSCR
ncbi:glycogen debranching N-terminal domain-containing protein [Paeniglutamicibacter sulfureus]|uniref:glycogen debranching N-terminal domain-containing protein n=1 Tax=Paeniglutamicibacter sulfureus TaxID=43666 RepID=UPI00345CA135